MLDQDQYWLGHLKAIDASGTTTKAYGKLHGLNVQKLYEWRKKFKTRQAPERSGSVYLNRYTPMDK